MPTTRSSAALSTVVSATAAGMVMRLAPAHEQRHTHDELLAVALIDAQRDGGRPACRVQHHIAGRRAILDLEPAAGKTGEDFVGRARLRLLGFVLGWEPG